MAGIEEYLDKIEHAVYGRDVRQAIHDGIQQCYYDGKAGAIDLEARQEIAELVAPSGEAPSAAEVTNARIGADGVTYTSLGLASRTQLENLNKSKYDAKSIDSAQWYKSNIEFEQGSVTSSGESASDYDIRTGYIDDGFYISNPNGAFAFVVLEYDEAKTFKRYISASVPTGSGGMYKDELFFVPPVHNGFYRVRVKRYINGTQTRINPTSLRSLDLYFLTDKNESEVKFSLGTLSSAGYARSTNEIVSNPISLSSGHNAFSLELKNSNYRIAVYYSDGNELHWGLVDETWLKSKTRHIMYDSSHPNRIYALRIATSSGSVTFNYDDAVNAIKIDLYDVTHGYSRDYDDITPQITLEHKSISSTGIVDSNNALLGKLPNNGNVEVKMNAPMGKFAVYKVTDGNITELTDGWTHYQYRYTGDYVSDYYVCIQYEDGNAISIPAGYQIIRAYLYNDFGKAYPIATKLQHRNIAFFGDSIVQGRFCKNGETVNLCMAKPYSVLISEIIGDETPMNYGIGGGLVYDSDWKSMYRNVGKVTGYDTVFFCAGTNDYGGNVSSTNFTDAYRYVIETLMSNNTEVVVCTPTMRRNMGTNGANMTLQDYADIEKSIANEKGLAVIDLLALTNYNNPFYYSLTDGLHPNEVGHGIIADIILREYELL